jgi:hypothetical protein
MLFESPRTGEKPIANDWNITLDNSQIVRSRIVIQKVEPMNCRDITPSRRAKSKINNIGTVKPVSSDSAVLLKIECYDRTLLSKLREKT